MATADFTPRYLADYQAYAFQVSTVNLTVELNDNVTVITNTLSIIKTDSLAESIVLDGEQLSLISIRLNEQLLTEQDYQLTASQLEIFVSDNEFTLTIVTEIDPENNTSLEGLYKSAGAFCTQCEAEGFRRISYFPDRPDVMAVYTTKIIANKKQYPYLLSNGNKIDSGDLNDTTHYVTWLDPFPKPCYLFALVAGDFDLLTDSFTTCSGREVALEIFVDKGNKHKAIHAMKSLQRSMLWDEETFGLEYDLDIYMIVAVDFFNMGAMENKGLNVFNSKFVLADNQCATDVDYFNIEAVIAHEYFHNWTGNRVTCRDWFQLSLKEGLTVFRDQQFSADMHSSAVTRIQNVRVLRSMQFLEDSGPMAHPIRPEKVIEMNNFYTLTVYEKGAEVIRMLHTLLGKSGFRKGMDLYFTRFDGMAVTCDDFVNAMADATQTDLSLFKRWYSQSGTPVVDVKESFDAQSNTYTLTLCQHTPETANQPTPQILHIPINIELIESSQSSKASRVQQHCLELKKDTQTWTFNGFAQKPIVALLADFSAPIKLSFIQDDEMLTAIITQASDSFCRWDAGQKLLQSYLEKLILNANFVLPSSLADCFKNILTSKEDHAFIAEQLILPSFDELVDITPNADPLIIMTALKTLTVFLAENLQDELLLNYQHCTTLLSKSNSQKNANNESQHVAYRAFKNVCLTYLSVLPKHKSLIESQFNHAFNDTNNMTDVLAALQSCAQQNDSNFDVLMSRFEAKWQTTSLVMDKWFSVAASLSSKEIFSKLEQLQNHSLFTLKNPNRARSLISAFTMKNPQYFHCQSGQGYRFLSKQIAALNKLNPQVAARLITPLIQFKSFAQPYQQLMKNELLMLQGLDGLAKDLQEKIEAALG